MPPINPQTIQLLNYASSTEFERELMQESLTELDSNLDIQVYYKCNIIIQDYELLRNVTVSTFNFCISIKISHNL